MQVPTIPAGAAENAAREQELMEVINNNKYKKPSQITGTSNEQYSFDEPSIDDTAAETVGRERKREGTERREEKREGYSLPSDLNQIQDDPHPHCLEDGLQLDRKDNVERCTVLARQPGAFPTAPIAKTEISSCDNCQRLKPRRAIAPFHRRRMN